MSHSNFQHFDISFYFIVLVNIMVIITILIISFWYVTKVFNICNITFALLGGLILHIILKIQVKFLSVLFLRCHFCYDCDSSKDYNKLYNNYCKLLSKNGSGINKSQILQTYPRNKSFLKL